MFHASLLENERSSVIPNASREITITVGMILNKYTMDNRTYEEVHTPILH